MSEHSSTEIIRIGHAPLRFSTLQRCLDGKTKVELSPEAIKEIQACRDYLDRKLSDESATFYGINTGFGSLCNVQIDKDDIEKLQENLVVSHACGMGDAIKPEVVRLMLLLKIQNMAHGHSGVSLELVERLVDFYNHDVLPVIYEQGSLGASGDLAPLAHLSLPLFNKGKVWQNGNIIEAETVCQTKGWQPLKLKSKEGLALLNGTQFMSALGVHALIKSHNLLSWANAITAASLDGFAGKKEPFLPFIHQLRPHAGQIHTAKTILDYLADSPLAATKKPQVQDPYSFRCVPQVHGATYDALQYVTQVLETEINAVTDNPTVVPSEDVIVSGGNFHGQPLALALDFLAIAMAEIANISERRIFLLISGQNNLPDFLVKSAGLDSGLMIAQYSAASMVSQNKQLATPASVDSIVSSNGQEDHVSMGANAATKVQHVINNVQKVLGIELICASQALSYREKNTGSVLQVMINDFRQVVPIITADRVLHDDMVAAQDFLDKSCPEC